MKKLFVSFLAVFFSLCLIFTTSAMAENELPDFDWDSYSLEELLAIQEDISRVITEKQIQYAMEHGDRTITLEVDAPIVYVGGSLVITSTVERVIDTAPEETELIWSSSDESIVKVSDKGEVMGVGTGEAEITCSAADNEFIFAKCSIQAVLPVTDVSFEEKSISVLFFTGEENTVQLECEVSPADAFCKDVEWFSNNEEIAVVDENGLVSLLQPGNVTITARSLDSFSERTHKEATCTIKVLQAASLIELDQTNAVLNVGSSFGLKATVTPDNTSNKAVVWESSNPEVASVSNGTVRALTCGDTEITCTAADGSGVVASCKITVIQMVTAVKIVDQKSPVTLNRNESLQLMTEISPENATDKSLTWTSSDSSIVTVSNNGTIKAISGGTATVSCCSNDGSEKGAKIDVFVPSISLKNDEYTVVSKDGLSFTLSFYGKKDDFEISPNSTQYFDISYSLSKEIVTVEITPLKAGKASITVKDKADSKNNRTISIVVDHEAVYDSTSYPAPNYSEVLRNPDRYKGEQYSIYGKVLQITEGGTFFGLLDKYYIARIGTSGYGYYDNVYYVIIDATALDENIIEDDMVTVYGVCTGTYTYTALLGNKITIPSLDAEKVVLGRGN